jgi:hypothetical protein
MNGGGGYLPSEIGEMSLDQIWFRLCDTEILKRKTGYRTKTMESAFAVGALKPDKDGYIKGRDADGNPILKKMKVGGMSLNRRLMLEAEEQKKKERALEKKKKRRGRRRGK